MLVSSRHLRTSAHLIGGDAWTPISFTDKTFKHIQNQAFAYFWGNSCEKLHFHQAGFLNAKPSALFHILFVHVNFGSLSLLTWDDSQCSPGDYWMTTINLYSSFVWVFDYFYCSVPLNTPKITYIHCCCPPSQTIANPARRALYPKILLVLWLSFRND